MYTTIIKYRYPDSSGSPQTDHAILKNKFGHPMEGSTETEHFDLYFRAPVQGMQWECEVYEKGTEDVIDDVQVKILEVIFPQE